LRDGGGVLVVKEKKEMNSLAVLSRCKGKYSRKIFSVDRTQRMVI